MYTKNYHQEHFPYKDLIIKLSFILLIVIFLIFLSIKIFNEKKQNIENNEQIAEVFSSNLEKMKKATLLYLTEDKLPQENNKNQKITLELMIKKKVIPPIVDHDKNLCHQKKSYAKIVKNENEYTLKINLTCQENSDYIVAHVNHYDYCKETFLCEKKTEIETEKEEETEKKEIIQKEDNDEKNLKTKTYTNNKKTKSSKIVVKRKKKKPSLKGNIIITDTTHKNYLYEYIKTTDVLFSPWSKWSNLEKTSCKLEDVTCSEKDTNCLKEIKKYTKKENTNTYHKTYDTKKLSIKYEKEEVEETCNDYQYININQKIYKTRGNYTNINNQQITQKNKGDWIYKGRASYKTSPTDTINTRYLLVGPDYSTCNNTCSPLPNYYYDQYIYLPSIIPVNSYTENCINKKRKNVYIYQSITESIHFERNEKLYGTVCYKSERTRTVKNTGKTSKKWSYYNDKNLLNKGYYYTGNSKKR